MLYDPKWEQQTKADPLSLGSLIAWLETKDPDEGYSFWNCEGGCLIGQYLTAMGHPFRGETYADLSYVMHKNFGDTVAIEHPRTFGGALARARGLLKTA